MGMVAARYGLHLDKKQDKDRAEKQFKQAVDYFRSARLGFFPNSYPFYSESWMFYTRARNSTGSLRLELLARALQVLDESDGNVAQDEKASLQEMEAKIVQYLGSIPNLDVTLADLAKQGAIACQYLQARRAAGLYSSGYDVRSAYSILSAALETSPDHVPCLRLASRLYPKVYPGDWGGWWKLLKHRYQLEGGQGDCGLLFSLGQTACQLGNYTEAARLFEQLDAESIGNPLRSGIVQVVKDGDSERRFTGTVGAVPSRFEGWVRSDSIGREIKCVPVRQKFTIATGQTVTFSLGLNYRGFLAIELRPT
jgi:tetratricopeptide (TPR) repeat protein